jgi:hypothetical protein
MQHRRYLAAQYQIHIGKIMTKEQKDKARALLEKDCELTCNYFDGEKTCAIGCLALAAGVSKNILLNYEMPISANEAKARVIAIAVKKEFGLSRDVQRAIQSENDEVKDIGQRRHNVLCVLDEIQTDD